MKPSPLLSIFLIVVVDVLGLTIILPLLPFYAESLGASPQTVGLLVSVYAFCQLIAGPVLGRWSDRIGRRPVLLASQAGTFAGFLLMAAAQSLPVLFLARIIDGLTAGNLSVAQAYIADVTEPEDRSRAFALIGIAFGIGFMLGPAISGLLAGYSIHYPILLAAGLSACSIVATWTLLESSPAPRQTARDSIVRETINAFKNPTLAPLLLQFTGFMFSFSLFMGGFALFAERRFTTDGVPWGPRDVGLMFAYAGLVGVVVQGLLFRWLVQFWGESRTVRIGFISMAAGYVVLAESYTLSALVVAATLQTFGSAVARPSLTSLITQRVPREKQGAAMGFTQGIMSMTQISAPVLGGYLIGHGYLTLWGLAAAGACVAGMLFMTRSVPDVKLQES